MVYLHPFAAKNNRVNILERFLKYNPYFKQLGIILRNKWHTCNMPAGSKFLQGPDVTRIYIELKIFQSSRTR